MLRKRFVHFRKGNFFYSFSFACEHLPYTVLKYENSQGCLLCLVFISSPYTFLTIQMFALKSKIFFKCLLLTYNVPPKER